MTPYEQALGDAAPSSLTAVRPDGLQWINLTFYWVRLAYLIKLMSG